MSSISKRTPSESLSPPDPSESAFTSSDLDQPRCFAAIELLRRAWLYAEDTNRDLWDFAVEACELEKTGLTVTDFRWLTCKEYVRHGSELTSPGSLTRTFRECNGLKYESSTCFVLTKSGFDFANSILDAPQSLCDRVSPRESSSGSAGDNGRNECSRPHWDCDSRELRFQGRLVKQFKVPSPNQEIVIMSFQEEGWPTCIDDPLPHQAGRDPKQRLHDTIRSLNRNQKNCMLRFKGNGTGQGILWQPVTDGCCEEEEHP